jgi:predicted transcriptional regulator
MTYDKKLLNNILNDIKLANNDLDFRSILNKIAEIFSFNDLNLAQILSVSRPTISRWRKGKSYPHIGMRNMVYRELEKLISNEILLQ